MCVWHVYGVSMCVAHAHVCGMSGHVAVALAGMCVQDMTRTHVKAGGTHEGACSGSKAPSSAPTISSEKICCATKLLLPSFAPSYQTGLI